MPMKRNGIFPYKLNNFGYWLRRDWEQFCVKSFQTAPVMGMGLGTDSYTMYFHGNQERCRNDLKAIHPGSVLGRNFRVQINENYMYRERSITD